MGKQAIQHGGTMMILMNTFGNSSVYQNSIDISAPICFFFLLSSCFSLTCLFPLFSGQKSVLSWGGQWIGEQIFLCIQK